MLAVCNRLLTFALTHLTPTQVAVYVNVNPMVAIILGAALLRKKLLVPLLVDLWL
jgi:drug/metabolite transporter (DMT)-like permease